MALTYQNADAQLQGRCKDRRKVANNTYLERRGKDKIALRLHATDILVWENDNITNDLGQVSKSRSTVTYNTGGWKTPTTKQRMNEFGPLDLWSDRGIWHFRTRPRWDVKESRYVGRDDIQGVYADGMYVVEQDSSVVGAAEDPKKEKKARARVVKYCKDYMAAFVAGNVPAPSYGDCWYCLLRNESGQAIGEAMPTLHSDGQLTTERATEHIESHIEEKYYVPSLLQRAMEVGGASHSMWWWVGAYWDTTAEPGLAQSLKDRNTSFEHPRVERLLRKYVLAQMGMVR